MSGPDKKVGIMQHRDRQKEKHSTRVQRNQISSLSPQEESRHKNFSREFLKCQMWVCFWNYFPI
jgi:hypothetical protein